jgi:hypothetical protein
MLETKDPRIKTVVFWLDADKRMESFQYAKKQSYLKPSGVVYTEKDPKDCTDDEIIQEVNEVIETLLTKEGL